jgi:hypothetical protein
VSDFSIDALVRDLEAVVDRLDAASVRMTAFAMAGTVGKPVEGKLLGDGMLALFGAARDAIDVAVRGAAAAEASGLRLRLGLHAGDVIREAGNVYGGAVNVAARISAVAGPGEVLVSDLDGSTIVGQRTRPIDDMRVTSHRLGSPGCGAVRSIATLSHHGARGR